MTLNINLVLILLDESLSSTKSNDSLPLKSPETTAPSPSPAKKAKSSQRGGRKRAARNIFDEHSLVI